MRAVIALIFSFAAGACGLPPEPPASNDPDPARALEITNAWASPTPAGVTVSAGYLNIHNQTTADDRLLSATSARAERVEIHEMSMDGTVMRMRPLQSLDIPAGHEVSLAPGGKHLMFFGVAQPFAQGEEIPVRLSFETAGSVEIMLPVRRESPEAHGAH